MLNVLYVLYDILAVLFKIVHVNTIFSRLLCQNKYFFKAFVKVNQISGAGNVRQQSVQLVFISV